MVYTEDWFSNNIELWKKHLLKLSKSPIKVLEIGTFEGRSAIWLLENILKHPDSRIYCVDQWSYKSENKIYKTFLKNIEKYKNKVHILKGKSQDQVRKITNVQFDFIYIDASRHSQNVLEDAILSFPLLKSDGIMIFDDYTNNKEHDINCPKKGIDAFIDIYAYDIKVLHTGWQVVIQKRKTPLKRRPCYSEFYSEPNKTPLIFQDL